MDYSVSPCYEVVIVAADTPQQQRAQYCTVQQPSQYYTAQQPVYYNTGLSGAYYSPSYGYNFRASSYPCSSDCCQTSTWSCCPSTSRSSCCQPSSSGPICSSPIPMDWQNRCEEILLHHLAGQWESLNKSSSVGYNVDPNLLHITALHKARNTLSAMPLEEKHSLLGQVWRSSREY